MNAAPAQPSKPRSMVWQVLLGLLVSLLCLGLAFYQIDLKQLWHIFQHLNYLWVGVAAGLVLLAYLLRALLWRELIGRRRPTHLWNLFRIVTLGYLANNLLPLKLGEILRAWLLGRRENLPTSLAIGTVVVERLLDLFALLFYFGVTMFLVPFAPWLKLSGQILAGAGVGLAVLVLASRRYGMPFIERLESPLRLLPGGFGPWFHRQAARFVEGLQLVETLGQLGKAYGWCLLTWLAFIGVAYASCLALGLQLSFAAALFLMVVLNFGLMIPSSPGGLGVFEFMIILALTPFGVSKAAALGVGFTFHMVQYLITFIFGWLFAMQFNISMLQVYRDSEQTAPEDPAPPAGVA